MKPKVFIMSGISGTGKTHLQVRAGRLGYKCLRSFNKFLLDSRFGDGQQTYKSLVMYAFMQVKCCGDFDEKFLYDFDWMIDRSILDYYYYLIKSGYVQSEQDIKDMNHICDMYFNELIRCNGNKDLIFIDIWNKDPKWIESVINEDKFRKYQFDSVENYLKCQDEYKSWLFSKLDELNIKYDKVPLIITDVSTQFDEVSRIKFLCNLKRM